MIGRIETFPAPNFDCLAKVQRIPVGNDCGNQIEAYGSVVLSFDRVIADFALAPDPQGILERVVSFPPVETDL